MIRVYYMMCGTQGREVGSSFVKSINASKNLVITCDKDGKENGHTDLRTTFLTEKQARDDWRRRSDAETTEHADAIQKIGEELVTRSEKMRKKVRTAGPWQDL